MGVRGLRIVTRHLIPNIGSLLVINFTLGIVAAVTTETGLSFIGFGVKIPDVSLGSLIGEGSSSITSSPWLFYFPRLVLTMLTVSMALIADGLRDALDHFGCRRPRMSPVLSVREPQGQLRFRAGRVDAVRGVSFDLEAGKTLGIVGESGSGKSVTSLAVMGLLDENAKVSGSIVFDGQGAPGKDRRWLSTIRGNGISMIFRTRMTSHPGIHDRRAAGRGADGAPQPQHQGGDGALDRSPQAGRHHRAREADEVLPRTSSRAACGATRRHRHRDG